MQVMVNVPTILPVSHTSYPQTAVLSKLTSHAPQLTFAFQLIYILALSMIKASILCFYRRVFVSTRLLLSTKVMFGVVAVWGLAHSLTAIFICAPVSYQWDLTIKGKCGDQIKLFQSLITTNILTDAMIMIIPVYSTSSQCPVLAGVCTLHPSDIGNSCVASANAQDRKSRRNSLLPNRYHVSPPVHSFSSTPH
jgi:hypothetical protein